MEKSSVVGYENKISISIAVRTEKLGNKKVFIVNNEDLGIADFGDTLEEAISNFRKSARLYLDTYPSRKKELVKQKSPVLVSRIFL